MSEELIPGVMKNIDAKTVVTLKDQVACLPGQVISKTLAQNDAVSVTLFGFGAGEEIASHRAGGDAFVTILEGRASITIDDDVYNTCTSGSRRVQDAAGCCLSAEIIYIFAKRF